jgi:2,3-bisphosphoglycerate-dependent phosphoglycerate mutase
MSLLVIIRHGATQWAEENRFAGWGDTPLSKAGELEAEAAADSLLSSALQFDVMYYSKLLRAKQTIDILMSKGLGRTAQLHQDWRLNERHYGALQGRTREEVIAEYGNELTLKWRRSFDISPPPFLDGDERWKEQLERFSDLPHGLHPRSESIRVAAERVAGFWHEKLAPKLAEGQNFLVVAHTSSIRGLTRLIENLDDAETENFRIPTAVPVCYNFTRDMKSFTRSTMQSGFKSRVRSIVSKIKPKKLARF